MKFLTFGMLIAANVDIEKKIAILVNSDGCYLYEPMMIHLCAPNSLLPINITKTKHPIPNRYVNQWKYLSI